MFASARGERPHIGIANYSTALSLGMIAGPLAASCCDLLLRVLHTLCDTRCNFGRCIHRHREGGNPKIVCWGGHAEGHPTIKYLQGNQAEDICELLCPEPSLSMLLPILISYGGIYAESKFQIRSFRGAWALRGGFTVSTMMRVLFTRSDPKRFRLLLLVGFASLFASFLIIGSADNFTVFLLGFMLFSVPHALIYPITTFMALESGGKDAIITSTYIFATSLGIAEFISPLAAIPIIALYSFSWVFLAMAPISLIALVLSAMLLEFSGK